MNNRAKGFLALLTCGLIFGSFGILIRLLSQQLDSYQQIGFRNLIGFLLAVIIAVIIKSKFSLNKVPKKYIFLYMFSFPITVVLFTLSVLNTKIVISVFSLYAGSIISSLLIGYFIFHERITRMKLISLVLAAIGLIIFVYPTLVANTLNIGFIFGFFSGVVDTISNSFRKYLAGKIDRFVLVALSMAGGLIVATVLMFIFGSSFTPTINAQTLGIGLLFGSLLMVISYLMLVGFQNFDLNLGTIVIASELFFAPLFASLVFNENPGINEVVGGIFILLAIVIPNIDIEKRLLHLNKKK